jgi:hypothetical protein
VPPAKKGSAGAWVKGHKPEAALGGLGIAVTLFLAYRARKANAAAGASGSTTPASTAVPVSTADTTSSDAFSGLESQVVGLQSALLALQNPAGPSSGSGGGAGSASVVSGSWGGNPDQQNVSFDLVSPGANLPSYTTLFESPAPGVFEPVAPGDYGTLPAGSSLYALPSATQPFGFQQWGYGGKSTGLTVPKT